MVLDNNDRDQIYEFKEGRLNLSFDTHGKILEKTLSSILFNAPVISQFLHKIEPIVEEMIKMPRNIKIFTNWAVSKTDKFIH
jgi:hypothetical protein